MHDWKQNESYIIIEGAPFFVNSAHVASTLTRVHEADLAELQAKLDAEKEAYQNLAQLHDEIEEVLMKDEYKQRLDAVLELLESKILLGFSEKAKAKHNEAGVSAVVNARELYTEALAIARGEKLLCQEREDGA